MTKHHKWKICNKNIYYEFRSQSFCQQFYYFCCCGLREKSFFGPMQFFLVAVSQVATGASCCILLLYTIKLSFCVCLLPSCISFSNPTYWKVNELYLYLKLQQHLRVALCADRFGVQVVVEFRQCLRELIRVHLVLQKTLGPSAYN